MPSEHESELPPLDGLDALDQERAADMVYNRPRYAGGMAAGRPLATTGDPPPMPPGRDENPPAATEPPAHRPETEP